MHITRVKVPGWSTVALIHNGDWSGVTTLRAWRGTAPRVLDQAVNADLELELEVAHGEVRACVRRDTLPADKSYLGDILAAAFAAGRAMGTSQLGSVVTRSVEAFE